MTEAGGVLIIYYFHMSHIEEKKSRGSGNSDKISHHNDFEAWVSSEVVLLCIHMELL